MMKLFVLAVLLAVVSARPGLVHSPLHYGVGYDSLYDDTALDLAPTLHVGTPLIHNLGHSYHHGIPAVSHQSSTIYHGHGHHYPSVIAHQPIYKSYSTWPAYGGLYGGWNGWD